MRANAEDVAEVILGTCDGQGENREAEAVRVVARPRIMKL